MATFKIAVEWSVMAEVEVEAFSLMEAKAKVIDPTFPLPRGSEYIDGTLEINDDVTDILNEVTEVTPRFF